MNLVLRTTNGSVASALCLQWDRKKKKNYLLAKPIQQIYSLVIQFENWVEKDRKIVPKPCYKCNSENETTLHIFDPRTSAKNR